jgi:TonB-dependent receptor
VYAKGAYSKYTIDNNQSYLNLGNLSINSNALFYTDTAATAAGPGTRTLTPVGIANGQYVNPYTPTITATGLLGNSVSNVDPKSVTVDASHHVTQMTINNAAAGLDWLHDTAQTTARTFQSGGTWNHGPLKVEFLVGDVKSDFQRESKRTSVAQYYGTSTMSVLPNGLWTYAFPANSTYNLYNPAPYAVLAAPQATAATNASSTVVKAIPAYTAAQSPNLTYSQPQLTYNGRIASTEERTGKVDLTYALNDKIPFLTRFKTGLNLRDTIWNSYTGGGYTVNGSTNPQIIVPSGNIRSSLVGCQDTAGSLATGGNKCNYGLVPSNGYSTALSNAVYVTPAALQDIIGQSLNGNMTATSFMNGVSGYSGVVSNWPQLNVDKLFALSGVPNANLDCIITCKANDGKVYPQPASLLKERTKAAYLMTDFNIDRFPFTDKALPFGWEIEGNIGYRFVKTDVHGTGNMTFRSITKAATFDTNGAVNDVSITAPTAVNASAIDRLPSLNAAVWVVPDKVVVRYSGAKTVARPRADRLLAQGTCTYDERFALDVDQRCSGTIGNPGLLAQKNVNQNLSVEYYPSKDTMVTLSYFVQHGIIGPELAQSTTAGSIGVGLVDPTTGKDLSAIPYDFTSWQNSVANTRKGWEFSTKTAFTFLPSILRFTGFDGNYTKLASVSSSRFLVDLLSGAALPPYRESTFQYNWAFWYDDGKLNARIAVQSASPYFTAIAGDSGNTVNNYPNASGNTRPPPYNPGSPNFRDKTRYVDAKISYKITPNLEIFTEARNLTNKPTSNSQGSYVPFSSGAPSLLDYSFTGRRIMAGLNFRYGG